MTLPLSDAKNMADVLKGLSDPTRLRLLDLLFNGEKCVSDLAEKIEMSQSAVSHQLRVLKDLGFVSAKRQGQQIYYQIDDEHIEALFQLALDHSLHSGKVGQEHA